jgi:hypothetical protein
VTVLFDLDLAAERQHIVQDVDLYIVRRQAGQFGRDHKGLVVRPDVQRHPAPAVEADGTVEATNGLLPTRGPSISPHHRIYLHGYRVRVMSIALSIVRPRQNRIYPMYEIR